MQIMIKQLSDASKYVNKSKRCQNILTQKITFRNATKSKFVYSLLIEVLQFCELKYNDIWYCVSHTDFHGCIIGSATQVNKEMVSKSFQCCNIV